MWFFVCKQKTAYWMRISDWSSDVCSSDVAAQEGVVGRHPARKAHPPQWIELEPAVAVHIAAQVALACAGQRQFRRGNARAIGADAADLERPHRGHAPIFHLQARKSTRLNSSH